LYRWMHRGVYSYTYKH
jgi:hypothetical protein